MPSGGARNSSGPAVDPHSGRTDARGLTFTSLPVGGYDGKAPKFPLPEPTAREHAVWREVWTTPQAAAWAKQPWRWREIGLYVRYFVRAEDPESSASLGTTLLRLRDEIGLSVAGMTANGWVMSTDQLAPRREDDEPVAHTQQAPATSARNRLRVANGDA